MTDFQPKVITDACRRCGYDLRRHQRHLPRECGEQAVALPHCPECHVRIMPWTCEDCPGCGRPLDCEADNDQLPPFGLLDDRCVECNAELAQTQVLQCPGCDVVRLLRLDFAPPDRVRAERVLQGHGLPAAKRLGTGDDGRRNHGVIYIRSCCWPSAEWIMEFAGLTPIAPTAVGSGLCRRCGYDLYGMPSSRCPECGTLALQD